MDAQDAQDIQDGDAAAREAGSGNDRVRFAEAQDYKLAVS